MNKIKIEIQDGGIEVNQYLDTDNIRFKKNGNPVLSDLIPEIKKIANKTFFRSRDSKMYDVYVKIFVINEDDKIHYSEFRKIKILGSI